MLNIDYTLTIAEYACLKLKLKSIQAIALFSDQEITTAHYNIER